MAGRIPDLPRQGLRSLLGENNATAQPFSLFPPPSERIVDDPSDQDP